VVSILYCEVGDDSYLDSDVRRGGTYLDSDVRRGGTDLGNDAIRGW